MAGDTVHNFEMERPWERYLLILVKSWCLMVTVNKSAKRMGENCVLKTLLW